MRRLNSLQWSTLQPAWQCWDQRGHDWCTEPVKVQRAAFVWAKEASKRMKWMIVRCWCKLGITWVWRGVATIYSTPTVNLPSMANVVVPLPSKFLSHGQFTLSIRLIPLKSSHPRPKIEKQSISKSILRNPSMVYLPTFTIRINQMWVSIPVTRILWV